MGDIIARMSAVGLASLTTVMVVLAMVAFGPDLWRLGSRAWERRRVRKVERARALQRIQDPGEALREERRAEQQMLEVLGPKGFETYRALGFLHVFAADGAKGYLIYPHTSIVSFDPDAGEPLDEYTCLSAASGPGATSKSADVLAKWEALTADEGSVASPSNMHLLGRDVDPARVRRDLIRLSEWASRQPSEAERNTKSLRHPPRGRTNT